MPWRLLVEECVPNMTQMKQKGTYGFFSQANIGFTPLSYTRKHKTHTSRFCGDFGSKAAFVILDCYNTIVFFKKCNRFFQKKIGGIFWYWCFYPHRLSIFTFYIFLHKSLHTSRVSVALKEQPTPKLTNYILYEYSN